MSWRMNLCTRLVGGSVAMGLGVAVMAAGTTAVLAESCFVAPAKLSDSAIQSFLATPDNLLKANPVGGYALTTQVRSLAGSDTDTLATLIALAGQATPEQIAAIGAGLAQAATACVISRPDIAEMIQTALAGSGNDELIVAFAASSGNTQTAALGPAGTGAVGGTGGATGGGAAGIGGGPAGAGSNGPNASTFANRSTSLSASRSGGSSSTTVSPRR